MRMTQTLQCVVAEDIWTGKTFLVHPECVGENALVVGNNLSPNQPCQRRLCAVCKKAIRFSNDD